MRLVKIESSKIKSKPTQEKIYSTTLRRIMDGVNKDSSKIKLFEIKDGEDSYIVELPKSQFRLKLNHLKKYYESNEQFEQCETIKNTLDKL